MDAMVNFINDLLWGILLVYMLLGAGAYFTIRLRFIQFRHFKHMFTVLKHSRSSAGGISSFQALCISLAARLGTGNLAGVAIALYLGGPGAIFWMWLIALISMSTAFAESSLAQLYKVTDEAGNYRGGPAYYMDRGLDLRWMGALFAVFLIVTFGLVLNAVQANAISLAMNVAFDIPTWVSGITLSLLAGLIIFGGLRTIARFAELIVPVMALAYLLIALIVVAMNLGEIPSILLLIVKSAFGLEQAGGGVVGYAMTQALISGIKRGLLSNEAGMGSAANAAALATAYPPHPASQGYIQMLGVFIDTLVICTCTAAIILLSGQFEPGSGVTGIELTQRALSHEVGAWGSPFIAIAILFFAFTSIVANYAYAENNLVFLEHENSAGLFTFRLFALGMVMFGAIGKIETMWTMAYISIGVMAMINLVAISLLFGVVIKLAKDYNGQRKLGLIPTFDVAKYPELRSQLEEGVWPDSRPPAPPKARLFEPL